MALIICPECGKKFSDKAAACPECGCPTSYILGNAGKNDEEAAKNASAIMWQAVARAKSEGERASDDFDRAAAVIQSMASDIELFSGHAVRQSADIAAKSKNACETLYTTYQSLVKGLDRECRPLLTSRPDAQAIREVADAMKYFNEESKIENNFSASLNSRSMGDFASVRFFPSMENLALQKEWEQEWQMALNRTTSIKAEAPSLFREKESTTQKDHYKALILKQMEEYRLYTITDMLLSFSLGDDMNASKLCPILQELIDEEKIVRSVDKRTSYFSLA